LRLRAAGGLAILLVLHPACSGGGGTATTAIPAATADANAPSSAAAPDAPQPAPVFVGGANQMDVTLFFLRADGEALAPETRRIFRTATVNDRARQALQALFEGSESGLPPSAPPGTAVREIYIAGDGTAYVDLNTEFRDGIERGSEDAVEAIYAVVNTLAVNFSEIQRVKILVAGDELDDVGGHLDLSHPILPEMSLVWAGSSRAPRPNATPPKDAPAPGGDPNRADPNHPAKSDDAKPAVQPDASPFRL
jgi:hypothetical protein